MNTAAAEPSRTLSGSCCQDQALDFDAARRGLVSSMWRVAHEGLSGPTPVEDLFNVVCRKDEFWTTAMRDADATEHVEGCT